MKKRVLSLFMALMLCLTLLPTAALAEELGPVDGTSTVETAGADAEAEAKAKAGAEAVAAVQAMIGELPSLGELKGMDSDTLNEAYMAVQSAYDAYEALSEEQQAQVTGADRFEGLFGWFNSQVAVLEDSGNIYPDVVESDGSIRAGISGDFSRNGLIVEGSNDSMTFYGDQYYVVKESSNVTINGDLIIDSCTNNGLILCKGATLTVTGALIHKGGTFPIYGVSDSGKNAGRLVIRNSSGSGAAIRSSEENAQLQINSGELEISGGSSSKLVDGVKLRNASKIHAATLDGTKVLYTKWDEKTSLTGTSLVLEYCGHKDAGGKSCTDYAAESNGQHHEYCTLCGFAWPAASCTFDGKGGYDQGNDSGHYAKCVCGNVSSTQVEHTIQAVPKDGTYHVSKCTICGYEKAGREQHTYPDGIKCDKCGFIPVANAAYEDYASVKDAMDALVKDHVEDKYVVTLCASSKIIDEAIVFDYPGKTITLDMAGCTLTSQNAVTLTVKSGTLRITGDANITQTGTSEDTYKPAIEVTGGSLVFEGDLTAQGGKYGNYDRQPAVKATGGTVEFKGALNLDGGLFLDSCERLASKLTQGRFYSDNNGQGQVYRVQIGNDFQHSYDLLADGYAFAEYDTATGEVTKDTDGNPVFVNAKLSSLKLNTDVIIVEHKHSIEEGQSACACGKQFEAGIPADDGTITYYETIDEAFANVTAGGTVKLMIDSDDWSRSKTIYVAGGPYTFDLNGHRVGHRTGDDFNQAFLQVGDTDGTPGTLTVLDSSAAQTGYFYELELYNGSLTVESGSFYRYWESAPTATGTMTFKGGTVDEFYATSANVETKLYGGTFGNVYNNIGGKPGDLLADNKAFFNRNNGGFVNGYDDRYQAVRDVVVKDHTHNIVDGSCECGFTCAHDWSDKNGVCKKANCGYHCPHNAGAAEVDGVYACDVCGQTVTAMVTAPDGTITYYADGYVGNNTKSGLYFAIQAAESGSTVAALGGGNVVAGGYVKDSKSLTLDMSNGKPISGTLNVGYTNPSDTGNKLIVRGSAEISAVVVDPGNTLDLTGWTGRMGSLTVKNGGTVTLNSGTFAKLNVNGAAAGSLLASGYAFQNADTGAYVEYSSTADMENVKVVKCPHSGVTLKEDRTGAECKYCGASFAATLDDAPYDTLDDAVSAWLKNGGTLKLYADAGDRSTVDFSSGADKPFVIDLNGFAFNKDGAAITLGGRKSLTIMDSREKTSSAGAFGPVTADSGTLILEEGGYLQGLTVPSTSTADIKLRGGKVSALRCPVPVFNLLEDGYALMNGNITVDPTETLEGVTQTYTVKNAKITVPSMDRTAVIPFGQTTVPFPVSLTTGDDEIGRVQFKWYVVKEDGTAAELTDTGDLWPKSGAYSYDVSTDGSEKAGWAEMKIGKPYDVICVAVGKESDGAYRWQTVLKNFKITVEKANLADAEIKFTKPNQVTFDPFSAVTTAVPNVDFTVTCGGRTLVYGTDYTVTGNTASGVSYNTLTISAVSANYTGTKTANWEVIEYMLSRPTQTLTAAKQYDGTTDLSGSFVTSEFRSCDESETRAITLTEGTDYTVSDAHYLTPDVGDNKEIAYTITLLNKNYVLGGGYTAWDDCDQSWPQPVSASITQAAAPTVTKSGTLTVVNGLTHTRTLDLSTLLPVLTSPMEYGKVTYQVAGVDIGAYHDASQQAAVDENGRLTIGIKAVDTKQEGPVGTVTVRVSSTNIQDFTLTINVSAENKILPTGEPKLSRTTIAYGSALSTITLSGTMTDEANGKTVSGTFTWTDPDAILAVGSHQAEWRFTPADGDTYAETTGTVSVTVNKATPAGNPKYTAITTSGKKLSDAALAVSDKWPEGTVKWVDKDGKELPADTEVKANTAYTWVFTPNDTENYNTATGKLTLYSVSTGGGGGGGAAAAPSVTVPVSSAKSTVTVDASVSGSTAGISISDRQIESVTSDGGSVTVDVSGLKNVDSAKLPSSVIGKTEQAGAGLTVALPTGSVALDAKALESIGTGKDVTVSVQQTTLTDAQRSAVSALAQVAVVVDVNVVVGTSKQSGFGGGRLTVSIPYALKSGEDPAKLAVWFIRDDGTIENKGGSYDAKAGAFVFTTEHLSQYLLVNTDNVLTFTDVPATAYYAGAVAWAAEKGVTSGTKDGRFDPNGSCTRAQIVTFLWRAAGSPEPKSAAGFTDVSNSAYYAKAVAWAVENGVTSGTKAGRFDPDAPCTRAQSVTFLYRAAGSPAVTGGAGFSDVATNAYYAAAVAWAVETGVTTGTKDGGFSPNTACTRAQIVTFLYRSVK